MRNPKLKMGDFESRPGGVLALSRGGVQRQRQGGHALPRVLDIVLVSSSVLFPSKHSFVSSRWNETL